MVRGIRLVYGVGINDADYPIGKEVGGKLVFCQYYLRWKSMLTRCYSKKCQEKQPTYAGCSVCDEWLIFSNFKQWMEKQDWQGKHLDKDLLIAGNKIYSPETCVFVDQLVNAFSNDKCFSRGDHLAGAFWHKKDKKYYASCCNPFTKKQEWLGSFDCKISAHLGWKKRKHELAIELASIQPDKRVAEALKVRYEK